MITQVNIQRFNWSSADVSEKLAAALRSVSQTFPQLSEDVAIGRTLAFRDVPQEKGRDVCRVSRKGNTVTIEHSSLATALRGVGTALGGLNADEGTPFSRLGVMIDCSRDSVPHFRHFQQWITRLALMGYNYALLYCEDTYKLPDEPYFGYMRGAYSMEELKRMDDFADSLGVELIGCIQVLGHMEQTLKWGNAYADITDTERVMMIDNEGTQALIRKMVAFWAQALRSRRLHVGMDEAHDMLRGKFLDQHGAFLDPFDAFNRHLAFVNGVCKEHGLQAMIWSDMYFRLNSPKQEYYNCKPIPPEVAAKIPKDVQLVYWDYYHKDEATYVEMMKRHQEAGFQPVFGSGCWTWGGNFWYEHDQTIQTVVPGLAAARKCAVTDVFFTLWGDDGGFCDMNSALAGLARCADLAFGAQPDDETATAARFSAICKTNYEGVVLAAKTAGVFTRPNGTPYRCGMSVLLCDDPLLGIVIDNFAAAVPGGPEAYLGQLVEAQQRLHHFHTQTCGDFVNFNNLLRLLILKLQLRLDFVRAYQEVDMRAMKELCKSRIPEVIEAAKAFQESYSAMWMRQAKPFGLEVIQARTGRLIARLEEMQRRVKEYVSGKVCAIPELDERIPLPADLAAGFYDAKRAGSPSMWM